MSGRVPYRTSLDGNRVARQMNRLPREVHRAISAAILALEEAPRPYGVIKLTGRNEYRIRVGRYRIIYEIDDAAQEIIITKVAIRSEHSYDD